MLEMKNLQWALARIKSTRKVVFMLAVTFDTFISLLLQIYYEKSSLTWVLPQQIVCWLALMFLIGVCQNERNWMDLGNAFFYFMIMVTMILQTPFTSNSYQAYVDSLFVALLLQISYGVIAFPGPKIHCAILLFLCFLNFFMRQHFYVSLCTDEALLMRNDILVQGAFIARGFFTVGAAVWVRPDTLQSLELYDQPKPQIKQSEPIQEIDSDNQIEMELTEVITPNKV